MNEFMLLWNKMCYINLRHFTVSFIFKVKVQVYLICLTIMFANNITKNKINTNWYFYLSKYVKVYVSQIKIIRTWIIFIHKK